jgi:asparagine synthase (glutamine-hydrolysing)
LDTPKYILKKVAQNYLPNEIIFRRKVGFPVPLTNWFPNLKELAIKYLTEAYWLKPFVLNELISELQNSKSNRMGQLLWMFINVELFRRKYFTKTWKGEIL